MAARDHGQYDGVTRGLEFVGGPPAVYHETYD